MAALVMRATSLLCAQCNDTMVSGSRLNGDGAQVCFAGCSRRDVVSPLVIGDEPFDIGWLKYAPLEYELMLQSKITTVLAKINFERR